MKKLTSKNSLLLAGLIVIVGCIASVAANLGSNGGAVIAPTLGLLGSRASKLLVSIKIFGSEINLFGDMSPLIIALIAVAFVLIVFMCIYGLHRKRKKALKKVHAKAERGNLKSTVNYKVNNTANTVNAANRESFQKPSSVENVSVNGGRVDYEYNDADPSNMFVVPQSSPVENASTDRGGVDYGYAENASTDRGKADYGYAENAPTNRGKADYGYEVKPRDIFSAPQPAYQGEPQNIADEIEEALQRLKTAEFEVARAREGTLGKERQLAKYFSEETAAKVALAKEREEALSIERKAAEEKEEAFFIEQKIAREREEAFLREQRTAREREEALQRIKFAEEKVAKVKEEEMQRERELARQFEEETAARIALAQEREAALLREEALARDQKIAKERETTLRRQMAAELEVAKAKEAARNRERQLAESEHCPLCGKEEKAEATYQTKQFGGGTTEGFFRENDGGMDALIDNISRTIDDLKRVKLKSEDIKYKKRADSELF
jgi:hypothetical protein